MREIEGATNFCFDDILLVPNQSTVNSRKSVDLSMNINKAVLGTPVISSPMDTVTTTSMARAMAEEGGLGVIHRYMSMTSQCQMVYSLFDEGYAVGAAVGATDDYIERAVQLEGSGAGLILVDTANGHSDYAINAVKQLRSVLSGATHIMAGNVATGTGYIELALAGADSVRVGIGGGSVCTTRMVTGHGVPTLASIMDCAYAREYHSLDTAIIADGGIRNSGDAVKAFAAGADAVMLGSLLAGTDESPGEVINGRKHFRGMASRNAQEDWRGSSGGSEGVVTTAPHRGTVSDVLADFRSGIQSGCSYSGVNKLAHLSTHARFIRVSGRTVAENKPHAKEN